MAATLQRVFAPLPTTNRGHPVHLGEDPKGENILYTNGRTVFIRNLDDPRVTKTYTQHSFPVTVARYSPSGFYVASGDSMGNVRIWDATQPDQILKTESRVLSGRINDLAWDFESKRLIAVGEGKERFGHAFSFDTATSVGDIVGHSKPINAVAMNKSRPFRAATCSDDLTVNFYHGVPFKFNKTINDHTRFVQCVRFSPSGDQFVTAGMDAKMYLYDGKTGDRLGELTGSEGSHTGGILSVSWSPDGRQLLSCSSDCTSKIWDIESRKVVNTFSFGNGQVDDQQVGGLWTKSHIISLSLSGELNYLTPQSARPTRIIKGHQKAVTSIAIPSGSGSFYSGSSDGRVLKWSLDDGAVPVSGSGHTNQVKSLVSSATNVFSIGMDDTLRSIDVASNAFTPQFTPTQGLPNSLAVRQGLAVVASSSNRIDVVQGGAVVASASLKYTPSAVALSPSQKVVAVGDEEKNVHIYNLESNSLTGEIKVLSNNRGTITSLSFSPDGKYLAAADRERTILVFDTQTWEVKINKWMFHTARVSSISWSPDSLRAVSGSLDTNVEVWSVAEPTKHICIKGAHLDGVNDAEFVDNSTIVSVGQDATIKLWSI